MLDEIKAKYKDRTPHILGHEKVRKSAVMVPLQKDEKGVSVLFQVRGLRLKHQPGEICFPGGRVEPDDQNEEAAAIRETCEELGIQVCDIDVFGPVDIFVATHTIVYPFVCQLKDGLVLDPDTEEVHELFTVPLEFLLHVTPDIHYVPIEMKPAEDFPFDSIPGGRNYKWRKATVPEYFYRYQDKIIWGLTARILNDFLERIKKEQKIP